MAAPTSAKNAILGAVAASVAAGLVVSSFYSNISLPFNVGIIVFFALTASGLIAIRVGRYSLLPRLMIVIYSLPFATLLAYLWNGHYRWTNTSRGMRYSSDTLLRGQMVAVGTAGLLGLIVGMYLGIATRSNSMRQRPSRGGVEGSSKWRTLSPFAYITLLGCSWALSWFSAPTKTIFAAAYFSAGSQARSEQLNFNAAYLVSYMILVLLFIDAEHEVGNARRRSWKYRALFITTIAIVVFLQILRGNRESSGLLAAMMALYVTGPRQRSLRPASAVSTRRRVLRIAAPAMIAVLAFITVGSARSTLSNPDAAKFDLGQQLSDGWRQGTWTGVLLTNLSIAAQYRHGTLKYVYGQTYSDLALSLAPGPVAAALGLDRPLERDRGPAEWTKDISAGGAHIVIVPFKNFGMAGAFLVLCLYGFLIVRCEQFNDPRSFWGRLMYGSVVTGSFLWFWFGELSMVRALMIAGIVGLGYRAVCRARPVAGPAEPTAAMPADSLVLRV